MKNNVEKQTHLMRALLRCLIMVKVVSIIIMASVLQVSAGTNLTYSQSLKINDLPIVSNAAQKKELSGTVKDTKGLSLPGVTIIAKGTTIGTITDNDGKFRLSVPADTKILVFSFVGMKTKEVTLDNKTTINLVMEDLAIGLDEVVAIGYGSQRKRDITGAISTIDVSSTKDIAVSNITRLLVGQAPGVTVTQTDGTPGQEFEVTVRGMSSLGAGSQPLYVIDGFPAGTSVGQNLNSNDIETITILKDAASTAIYGARGSNGVILITTKNAKANEKVNLSVIANYGIQNIPDSRKMKMLNGVEFAQFKKDIFIDKIRYFENREPGIDEVPLDYRYPEQTKYSTNWFDLIQNKNASFQNYNITLTEGKGSIHSLVSLDYLKQEGVLLNTGFDRYSIRSNVAGKINDFIAMGWNLNGTYSNQKIAESSMWGNSNVQWALLMDPREPAYNEDGTYNTYIGGHDGVFGFPNPVQRLREQVRNRGNAGAMSNGFLEFSFLKNFKFKSSVNTELNINSSKTFLPSTVADFEAPPPRSASGYEDSYQTLNISTDQLLTYTPQIGKNHNLDVMTGYTSQVENVKGLSGSGNQYPDDLVPYLDAAIIKSSGSQEYGWSLAAYFSRLNYSYKGRYLFSGTYRREGSSRFGSKNKWGNFPALSAGWRISDESFMPKYSWLSNLKIRGSWGITGNNNIGNYSSLSFMSPSNYILGNNYVSGKVVSSFANADLGWEKSNQLDIGIDLAVFNNKLVFTAEYYNKITEDMLLSIDLPSVSGFTSSLSNIGRVQNKGFEFSANYKTKISAINFNTNFNISFNRNKVLAIRGINDEIWSGDGGLYADFNVSKVGRPIGMIYGFKVLGIFNNQAEIDNSPKQEGAIPGVYKYFDANGDGQISYDTQDMVEIANPYPAFTWGWNFAASFKNFDLNVLLSGAEGYQLYRLAESSNMNMDGVFNVLTSSKQRWRSEQNPGNGKYATTNTWIWERESNSRYVYDASHTWVKNVTVGYTLPKSNSILNSARLYISVDNLFLFTNYPGNPDSNLWKGTNIGLDDEMYPVARTFSLGAKLNF